MTTGVLSSSAQSLDTCPCSHRSHWIERTSILRLAFFSEIERSSLASSSRRSTRRAIRIKSKPRRASSRAIAAPMPEDAPVTRQ